jgi:methylated-DNA-protein-cysteine methyltransferase related protein
MKTTAASATLNEEKPDFNSWVVAVWRVVRDIPRGCVLTYGEVSRLAGSGGSPRCVSQALRKAPTAMKLPWHRVINSQGKISFPAGSHGYCQQKARLEKEGVVFLNGRINLQQFGYTGAIDKLLWGD